MISWICDNRENWGFEIQKSGVLEVKLSVLREEIVGYVFCVLMFVLWIVKCGGKESLMGVVFRDRGKEKDYR